ncbi:glycosyltransferase family 4 protein [Pedobacter antarcticus]|uniref:glycosyltransferase family 4 protein n=1 Tax=Pedobacter antarcticus TaxID=34086 RepID=UPI00088E9846|nr:glycosyltransferase family 4 protein [Pedobacter antarcticus]SDM17143.1 Glycosyltransferase involved in cell wall bisynthesis [Pedobacter antarcticus]
MKIIRTSTIPLSLDVLLKGQLKFLSNYFEIIGLSSDGELLSKVGDREGVKTIAIDMERGISLTRDLVSLLRLIKCFNREKPVIVHSITPKAGLLCMVAAKLTGVPIRMHTFTGLIFPVKKGFTQKLLIQMDRLLCWSATNIYPEGQGVMYDLIKYKITSKPLKVIANGNVNGVDLRHFAVDSDILESTKDLRARLGINPSDFVFIFVGRLVGDKGINELVEGFSILSKELGLSKGVKLLLVGPLEEDLDPLQDYIKTEIDSNPNIISVGFQTDVRPYFSISDALVFPSYREGFPNVVIQAGAMELPSIVSNINGCNEIIVEGLNGTIIPVKDVKAISDAMLRFVTDKSYYEILRSNARPMIQNRYEQHVVWDALLNEYKNLLNKKGLQ